MGIDRLVECVDGMYSITWPFVNRICIVNMLDSNLVAQF
eukprot:COSAG02_NODE_8277_length_2633_cov_3.391476_1_plen_38_part_10